MRGANSGVLDNLLLLWEVPALGLNLVLNGLLIGAIFALAAYGMALVWGVLDIINVAQGELVIFGGFIAFALAGWGVPPLLTVPLAAAVLYGVGWLLYRGILFRVVDRDLFISILATFGLSILIQQLLNQVFGADVRTLDAGLPSLYFFDGLVALDGVKLVAFALALAAGLALFFFLRYAKIGQAIRATAQNPRAARILGIDTDRVYATTFALNGALCGAAGALVVMAWTIQPYAGLPYTIRSFMVVVVAGVGNIAGVVASGLGLGVLENLAGYTIGAEFQIAFVFVLMVVILVARNLNAARKRSYLK